MCLVNLLCAHLFLLSRQRRQKTQTIIYQEGSPQVWTKVKVKSSTAGRVTIVRLHIVTIFSSAAWPTLIDDVIDATFHHPLTSLQHNIHCSSSIDDISRRAQDLVEKINDSRTSDQKVMGNFQDKLMEKVFNFSPYTLSQYSPLCASLMKLSHDDQS